jgi:predicted PurR-regulated permease PerM
MKPELTPKSPLEIAVDIFIRLGLLILLVAWCFQLVQPFSSVILWGIILALALAPLYKAINKKIGNRPKLTSLIIILCGVLILIIPSWLFLDSTIEGAKELNARLETGTLTIPPPSEQVENWPLIGETVYDGWSQASVNIEAFLAKYRNEIRDIGKSIVSGFLGVGGSILQFILAIVIAGVLLATKGTEEVALKVFNKLVGSRGKEFAQIVSKTVGNVTKGVLGVALIQAALVGIGFLLAGVPYAGIWALIVMILAILQLPPLIIILPISLYLFSENSMLYASLWTAYLVLAGASDNFIKPILLGKGAPVPMVVIFLGVIGGFMLSGFIGLFTGAIVLSIGYKLAIEWLENNEGGDSSNEVTPKTNT